jgi:hypothetical protein
MKSIIIKGSTEGRFQLMARQRERSASSLLVPSKNESTVSVPENKNTRTEHERVKF